MGPHPHSIWNPHATLPATTRIPATSTSAESHNGEAHPEREAARMAALKRLRHKLVTLCSKQQQNSHHQASNAKPPALAMERWLSRSSLYRELADTSAGGEDRPGVEDPILPSSGISDPDMVKDLSRNIGFDEAQNAAEAMAVDAKAAAERISTLNGQGGDQSTTEKHWKDAKDQLKACTKAVKQSSKDLQSDLRESGKNSTDGGDSGSLENSIAVLDKATKALDACRQKIQRMHDLSSGRCIVLDSSRRSGICDVMLLQADGSPKKPYLTISISHLIKFVQLWQFQHSSPVSESISPKAISQNPAGAIQGMSATHDFLRHLYCCLARYETIKGAGYQCAMPPVAFDAAHNELRLGMTVECFASPFNCRYRNYCSAFPDLERKFGSLGSFFDDDSFFPTSGSFEANPPFVPEIMWAMNDKLQRLLESPKAKTLSFLVIVPVWGNSGIGYVEQLETSDYCVAKSRVLAADHSFCDGAQHKALKQELRPSSWDTAVILLQNDAGKLEWPVSQEKLDTVFCTALKRSKTQASLADWERRGVGRGGKQNFSNNKRSFAPSNSQSPGHHASFKGKKTRF